MAENELSDTDVGLSKNEMSDNDVGLGTAQPTQPTSWGEVAKSAVTHIPSSAGEFAKNLAQPFIHPIDTARNLKNIGQGVLEKTGAISGDEHKKYADAVGQFFTDRYGGVENIKKTLAEDPVGAAADLSTVLTGGGGLAARAPGMLGRVGEIAGTVGRAIDPINNAAKVAKPVAKTAGNIASSSLGLTTGVGPEAIKTAAESGYEGGQGAKAFQDNLRGKAPMDVPVQEAKDALNNIRQQRGLAYRQGMQGIAANQTSYPGIWADIANSLTDASKVKTFKGQDLSPSTMKIRQGIFDDVSNWYRLPPEYHTLEGFDALKKKLYDTYWDATKDNTSERKVLSTVTKSIGNAIQRADPEYAKIMNGYESAQNQIADIEKTLSLNNRASIDTSLRKLQSVLRDNVNTSFGRRAELAKYLVDAGAPNLMKRLAGQAMKPWTPRGLSGHALLAELGAQVGALALGHPHVLAGGIPLALASSPRLAGEGAYYAGKLSHYFPNKDALRAAYQTGRLPNEDSGFAKGGAVKGLKSGMTPAQSRKSSHYSPTRGVKEHHCGICKFFIEKNKCSLVGGFIAKAGGCDWFHPITRRAEGGRIADGHFREADEALGMNQQEGDLYRRHLNNLYGPGGVDNPPSPENPQGSRSSLYQAVQEHGGKFYNIPTVWNGKREVEPYTKSDGTVMDVPNQSALDNVQREGWDKFPSYNTSDEADQRYDQMHDFMEKDTGDYLSNRGYADGGDPELSDTDQAQDAAEAAAARVRAPYVQANSRVSGLPDVGTAIGNRLINSVMAGPTLMGQVAHGDIDPNSEEGIQRTTDVAANTMGYGMMGAEKGLGMFGGRPTYSAAGEAVRNAKAQVMQPSQWLGYLKNQPGVKAQELEHVGLEPWLKEKSGPISKDELDQFVQSKQPEIKEVRYGQTDWDKIQPYEDQLAKIKSDKVFALRANDKAKVSELAQQQSELESQIKSMHNPAPQYGEYQLPGGENYGETLLTLPHGSETPEYKALSEEAKPLMRFNLGKELPDGKTVREKLDEIYAKQEKIKEQVYQSSHWQEPNVLLHVRHNDRDIPGQGKSLHLEELQSDLHQQGRKGGYDIPVDPSKYEITGNGPWIIRNKDTGDVAHDFNNKTHAEGYLKDIQKGLILPWKKEGLVPDAPFKQTWPDLGLKRMLHRAATEKNPDGSYKYDNLSWTPGKEHNNRYPGRPDSEQKGMEYFYDKMLPDKANSLTKKYGTKAAPSHIEVTKTNTKPKYGQNPNYTAKEPIWRVPITPELRKAAEKGFSTFYQGGRVSTNRASGGRVTVNPKIDKSYDIQWVSVLSRDGKTFYRDRSLPKFIKNNGKILDIDKALIEHEKAEYAAMQEAVNKFKDKHGREPNDSERQTIYLTAHKDHGEVAERKYIETHGYSWNEWNRWTKGQIERLEKKTPKKTPKNSDVAIYPHGKNLGTTLRADGGRVQNFDEGGAVLEPSAADPYSGVMSMPDQSQVATPLKKLLGIDGEERYQTWPERSVKGAGRALNRGIDLATGLVSGVPDMIADIPHMAKRVATAPRDALSGELQVNDPETGMPTPEAMSRANEFSGAMMGTAFPFAEKGALGTAGGRLGAYYPAERGEGITKQIFKAVGPKAEELESSGAATPDYHELNQEGAEHFHSAFKEAKDASPHGAAVHIYEPEDYSKTRMFLTPDSKAGFALKGDDIVSVFKHPDKTDTPNITKSMLDLATSQGGNRLDAFDTVLPNLYSKSGFRAVSRLPWNDEYAPPNWNYSNFSKFNEGRPDVVYMVHDPKNAKLYKSGEGKMVSDPDEAVRLQDEAIFGAKPVERDPGVDVTHPDWIDTRLPTGKKVSEPEGNRVVDLENMKKSPDLYEHNVGLIRDYPNMPNSTNNLSTDQAADHFVNHVKDNLLWLHDQVPPEVRERSKLWYDGARKIAEKWSKEFGIKDSTVSGVMAALSPQMDWFKNVSLARRVLDINKNISDMPLTSEMENTFKRIPALAKNKTLFNMMKGKSLSDIDQMTKLPVEERAVLKAMWTRLYDEAHHSKDYREVTPEGGFGDRVTTSKGEQDKISWGSLPMIAKAIRSIETDDGRKSMNTIMGMKHKIRNFYNNILVPNSNKGDVTIDTHAVAAGLLRPLSGTSLEVNHNFRSYAGEGLPNSKGSSVTGIQGTYPLYAEAYRRAAAERNILPREMQSITWEAIRGLFPGDMKGAKLSKAADDIWNEYKTGKASLDETKQKILEAGGGIRNPKWYRPSDELNAASRGSSDQGELPEPRLYGPATQAPGGGGRPAARPKVGGRGFYPKRESVDERNYLAGNAVDDAFSKAGMPALKPGPTRDKVIDLVGRRGDDPLDVYERVIMEEGNQELKPAPKQSKLTKKINILPSTDDVPFASGGAVPYADGGSPHVDLDQHGKNADFINFLQSVPTSDLDAEPSNNIEIGKPPGLLDRLPFVHRRGGNKVYFDRINELDNANHHGLSEDAGINDIPHRALGGRINHNPSEAQKEAGNYKKGKIRLHGLDISIENARGSTRSGVNKDGVKWKSTLPNHYGYIKGSKGADDDHIDVFVGPNHNSNKIFVINQKDADNGSFDEHKSYISFSNIAQVKNSFLRAFSDGKGKKRMGHITEMTVPEFKSFLEAETDRNTKP